MYRSQETQIGSCTKPALVYQVQTVMDEVQTMRQLHIQIDVSGSDVSGSEGPGIIPKSIVYSLL